MKYIWKKSCKNFLGTFFWAPIPLKRYQNTSDNNRNNDNNNNNNSNNNNNNNNNDNKELTK